MKKIKDFENIIVVPFFNDEKSLNILLEELKKEFFNQFYMVIVDDGSLKCKITDKHLKKAKVNGLIIKLKINQGHQNAIAFGIKYISNFINSNHKIIVMDCDGEDTPQCAKVLAKEIFKDDVDVIVAKRDKRSEALVFKLFYFIYKFIFLILTGQKIDFGNFLVLKKHSISRLILMPQLNTHLAATVISSGLRIKKIPINRGKRYAGESKMNFFSLTLHGFRSLMVFTEEVLVRVGTICILIAICAAIFSIIVVVLKIIGFSSPGWFSIALGILLLIMLQTGAISLSLLISAGKNETKSIITRNYDENLVENIFEN